MGLSAASVGLVVESGRGIDLPHWSVSSRVVCACWGSEFLWDPKQDFLFLGASSSCLFVLQVPPPGLEMCPGLVPSGGSTPPPGFGFGCCCCSRATCNRPCLLCVRLWFTRRTAAARSALCAVFGVCGCGAFVVALIRLVGFLVGLRLRASPRASPSGFAFGLRLRASPSGFAFGLRLRASPSGFAFGPARSHDSTQNPWAMPGVVPGFPTKHPRHTAVVFAADHRRAAFWSVSCLICCASPPVRYGRVRAIPHQVFYVKSAQICLRQPSRLNVILFAFPDHSRTEKVSDVSCLSRGLRRAPVSDEAPR